MKRALSAFSAVSVLAAPAGMAVQGTLLERGGITPSLLILGVIYQAAGLSMLLVPAFHQMDEVRVAGHKS